MSRAKDSPTLHLDSRLLVSFFALVFAAITLVATPESSSAQSINPRLRGMVGTSLLNPTDLGVLASWKANSYSALLITFGSVDSATREEYLAELNAAMDRLDGLLTEAARLNLRVLVNLYYPPGGFDRSGAKISHRIFHEAWAQQTLIDVWDIIATRYKDNDTIWGFQLVNEPAFTTASPGLKNWNELAQTLAENIRRIDSKHSIVVNPPFGDPTKLKMLRPITGVSNVVYAVNMYHPFTFTHQGLFPGYKARSYPSSSFRRTLMERYLSQIAKFQKRVKTPIHIHEVSAVRWAPNGSAARWLKDAITIFEKKRWSWSYHAFREAGVWNVELANVKNAEVAATAPTDRLKVLKGFFKRNR